MTARAPGSPPRTPDPRRAVRARFLAHGSPYGCAEAMLITLERHFRLADPTRGAAAMALNGGVAYGGGTCGAITGAAVALGRLAATRIDDRARAKLVARELTAAAMDAVRAEFGSTDCRTLTGVYLRAPGAHDAFIADGRWRVECTRRLELVADRLAPLADPVAWEAACGAISRSQAEGPGPRAERADARSGRR